MLRKTRTMGLNIIKQNHADVLKVEINVMHLLTLEKINRRFQGENP